MITKDDVLLAEAYISAYKKSVDVPEENVTDIAPDTNGAVEMHAEPAAVVLSLGTGEEESEHHQGEECEESKMAKTNLYSIFRDAKNIHDAICSGIHLDTWMLQKIAVVADNIAGVAKVVEYDEAKGEVE